MIDALAVGFTGLVDLAAETLGGRALCSSDEFFAAAANLVKAGRGTFIAGKFTERGKWMDGWESRRKRRPGHDWCILELGAPGRVLGFDIDTNHFIGNSPSFASVDGLYAPGRVSLESLATMVWIELLEPSPLRPGSQNLFSAARAEPVTHLRLNVFPDGGVARLRAFGRVHPIWEAAALDEAAQGHVSPGSLDLASIKNGGLALACSDAFFGPMNNLLLPGRAVDMGGGWETRRRRGPGHDWIVVRLGARGAVQCIEVDTGHFIGNFPERCSIDWIDSPDGRITDLLASDDWAALLDETPLRPDTRHFFDALTRAPDASHVRLNVFPDGGVSRLRVWGKPR